MLEDQTARRPLHPKVQADGLLTNYLYQVILKSISYEQHRKPLLDKGMLHKAKCYLNSLLFLILCECAFWHRLLRKRVRWLLYSKPQADGLWTNNIDQAILTYYN